MLLTKLANQEIVNFLRTATIKNSFFADQLLKALVNPLYQESIPARLNPYYLHLTGQYILKSDVHAWITDPSTGVQVPQVYSSEQTFYNDHGDSVTVSNARLYDYSGFDEMMYVTSLDTHDEIPFTRRVLHGCEGNTSVHKKTLEAYKVGGRYFNLLCEKYPKQVDLIKSIVYLVPEKELSEAEKASYGKNLPSSDELRMLNALDSEHLSLISCDSSILEEREREDILSTVRSILDIFRSRWSVKEYTYEDNYASVMWGALWSILPMAMIVQRYSNIKGPYVHSSHVWDYLTAHGLDSYRGYLTSQQEAFLYKNINYLRLHGGEHRILNILVDNLLSAYNLHIESKSVVIDTSSALDVDTVGTNYDTQCSRCARKEICFKNIKTYKCNDFLGTKDTCKPTSVILSEELPGARKDRILGLLKSRYGCTDSEANFRYERSFMWKDEAIEKIQNELDRDQSTVQGQTTETLSDTILEENASDLEPVFSQDVVDVQHADLRHARSAVIPTKLLEIVEDPTEPKYDEMFTRFLTDTLFHLAPRSVNGEYKQLVDESFRVLIGQEALQITLTYGEILAAVYLGFLREFKPNLVVDKTTSVGFETINGKVVVTDNRNVLTDFVNYNTFDFRVPDEAVISSTFKLGKPVKQEDLVSSMSSIDLTLRNKGTYRVTSDMVRVDGKEYFKRTISGYVEYTGAALDKDSVYYEFITLPNLVTNFTATNTVKDFSLVSIGNSIYAVTERAATSDDVDWYESYGKVYAILGRFDYLSGSFVYHENDNEIPVIPKYFRWFYNHLGIPTARTSAELKYIPMEDGDIGYVWLDKSIVRLSNGELNTVTGSTTLSKGSYCKGKDESEAEYKVDEVNVYSQNIVDKIDNDNYRFFSSISSSPRDNVWVPITDSNGNPLELELVTNSDGTAASVSMYYDDSQIEEYELVEIDKYVDVDSMIDAMYVDALNGFTNSEDLGVYIEKMFILLERLDMIGSSCGDIKTKMAIKVLLDNIMVTRGKHEFKLLSSGDLANPTYEDWFVINPDIGDALKKIDKSDDANILWNEFNLQLFSALLKYCDLSYASSSTSKTKYRKLKELVKSLSSYLVNYIDNQGSSATSTELPHIIHDTPASKLTFTSYVNFNLVEQTFNYNQMPTLNDLDEGIYLPVTETVAMPDVKYYVYDLVTVNNRQDEYTFVEDNVAVGKDITNQQRYFRVNLREEIGNETLLIKKDSKYVMPYRLVRVNGKWYYQIGEDSTVVNAVETYPSDPNKVDTLTKRCSVSDDIRSMLGSADMCLDRYYKNVASSSIIWDTKTVTDSEGNSNVVDDLIEVSDHVAELLELMTMSYRKTSVSSVTFGSSESGYVTADMTDYMIPASEMAETPYPSQTTKES